MRSRIVAAITVLFVAVLAAQETPRDLTITSNSRLVLVPVIVRTKSGKDVRGLGRDDFRVLEDGQVRAVSLFEDVHSPASQVAEPSSGNESAKTQAVKSKKKGLPITLVVLDEINTPYLEQEAVRNEMASFWSHRQQAGASALYVMRKNGLRLVQPLTPDNSLLITSLKHIHSDIDPQGGGIAGELPPPEGAKLNWPGGPEADYSMEIAHAHERDIEAAYRRSESETTLLSFQQIAHSVMAISGRKQLIWATAGFPFKLDVSAERFPYALLPQTSNKHMEGYGRLSGLWDHTWKVLNDSNVAVYPLNLHHIGNPSFTVDFTRPDSTDDYTLEQNAGLVNTMKAVADLSGGSMCFDGAAACLRKTEEDGSSYYLLGYYLPAKDTKPGWRRLQVKVDRPGVNVSAREGFFVADAHSREANLSSDLLAAIDSPMDYSGLPIKVGWKVIETSDGGATVKFSFSLPAQNLRLNESRHFNLTFLGVAHDQLGRIMSFSQAVTGALPSDARQPLDYSNQLQLPLGRFSVRLVVRDNESGQIGTSTLQVTVSNHKKSADRIGQH